MNRPTDELDSKIDMERILAALPPQQRRAVSLYIGDFKQSCEPNDIELKIDCDLVIARLPKRKRNVAELCKMGFVQEDIADILNISQRRVSQILQEIRKDFEDIL